MTERTNIPITENNKIFHTLHYNFEEEKIPLQYALELNTLDLAEAEEKKNLILIALEFYKFQKDAVEALFKANQALAQDNSKIKERVKILIHKYAADSLMSKELQPLLEDETKIVTMQYDEGVPIHND